MIAVVKLGGSLITDKNKPFKVRFKTLDRISSEIKDVLDTAKVKLILIHGGGSFGHYVASKYMGEEITSQGLIEIHEAMLRLNTIVLKYLRKKGVFTETIHTSSAFTLKNGRIYTANTEVIKGLLDKGVTPLLYGDIVYDKLKGFTIVSGDTLAAYLANALNAETVVFATNVNGIYRRYPPKRGLKDLIKTIDLKSFTLEFETAKSMGYDVTGGILFKLSELKKYIKCKRKVKVFIINGMKKGLLRNILLGKDVEVKTEVKVC